MLVYQIIDIKIVYHIGDKVPYGNAHIINIFSIYQKLYSIFKLGVCYAPVTRLCMDNANGRALKKPNCKTVIRQQYYDESRLYRCWKLLRSQVEVYKMDNNHVTIIYMYTCSVQAMVGRLRSYTDGSMLTNVQRIRNCPNGFRTEDIHL